MSDGSRELSEKQRKDPHREQWLDDRPCGSEERLLVPDLDIPGRQDIEQVTILPNITQIYRDPSAGRLDHYDRLIRQLIRPRLLNWYEIRARVGFSGLLRLWFSFKKYSLADEGY